MHMKYTYVHKIYYIKYDIIRYQDNLHHLAPIQVNSPQHARVSGGNISTAIQSESYDQPLLSSAFHFPWNQQAQVQREALLARSLASTLCDRCTKI